MRICARLPGLSFWGVLFSGIVIFPSQSVALMGKGILFAAIVLGTAIVADQQYNHGFYTDGMLSMLRQIQRSFGF